MASMLELVASSLLLLPWSCWWTEVSEGPAWSLNPLQEEEHGVSSSAPKGCNAESPRTSASRTESPLRERHEIWPKKHKELNSSRTGWARFPRGTKAERLCLCSSAPRSLFHTAALCGASRVTLSEADALECTTWQEHGAPCQVTTTEVPVTFTSLPARRVGV